MISNIYASLMKLSELTHSTSLLVLLIYTSMNDNEDSTIVSDFEKIREIMYKYLWL
jgi:hypothetical protein